jgi:hypothetical protein
VGAEGKAQRGAVSNVLPPADCRVVDHVVVARTTRVKADEGSTPFWGEVLECDDMPEFSVASGSDACSADGRSPTVPATTS